jgi:hypothetical protein
VSTDDHRFILKRHRFFHQIVDHFIDGRLTAGRRFTEPQKRIDDLSVKVALEYGQELVPDAVAHKPRIRVGRVFAIGLF